MNCSTQEEIRAWRERQMVRALERMRKDSLRREWRADRLGELMLVAIAAVVTLAATWPWPWK